MKGKSCSTLILIFLLLISMLFTGCKSDSTTSKGGSDSKPQEIVLNLGDEPSTLDPQLASDVVPMRVISAIFEGLYRKDKDGRPVPGVAENCSISPDGLTYTFKLKNANWPDGKAVVAEDFKTAWLRALDPKPDKHEPARMANLLYCIKGAEKYNAGEGKVGDVAVNAPSPDTLAVTLEKPTPYFLDLICNSVFTPVNREFYSKQPVENKVTKYGTDAGTISGNGPFTVKEWKHGEYIVLEKNENYWNKDEIKLEKVTYKMIKDASALLTAFKAGEVDMADITDESQRKECENAGGIINSFNSGGTYYIGFNNKDRFLSNSNIRKAIAYAIDRKTLVNKVLRDDSAAALGFVNPVIYGDGDFFRKQAGNLFADNDANNAKALLSKGLQELSLSKAPKFSLLVEDKETARRDAQAYQEMWRKNLGLDVEIVVMPWDAMLDKMLQYDYQAALLSWAADYNDPTAFLDMLASDNQFNIYGYANPAYDKLLAAADSEVDTSIRMNLLKEAEKMVMDQMVVCPVYFEKYSYAVKSKVKNLVRNSSAIQDIDLYSAYIGE